MKKRIKKKLATIKISKIKKQTKLKKNKIVIKKKKTLCANTTISRNGINEKKVNKKTKKLHYFDQNTEDAISLYNKTEDLSKREEIYNSKIKLPFEKLVECIFNTFKFSYFETGPLDVQKETISHLVANIRKYDPEKGKAFAYFSIVAKHYLIFLNNSNYKRFNQSVEIGEDREDNTIQLQSEDKYYKQCEISEFMRLMIDYWESNVGKIFSKQRDLNIANAVIELFRNCEIISLFNKKALYLFIREISDCKTQQITKIINKLKLSYTKMRLSYEKDGIIDIE